MKLGHIEIFVPKPLQADRFYIDVLGFELVTIQSDEFVWLKSGAQEILLRTGRPPLPGSTYHKSGHAFVLYCDDLAVALNHLAANGVAAECMKDSADCYEFQDPAGYWFQMVNPELQNG